jgi:hypothetical protein
VVEADLQRFYGVALTDLWTGHLSLRRLRVLLDHLPPDCATAYAITGTDPGPLRGWSLGDALLGRLVDELSAYRWQWETSHQSKGTTRRAPGSVLPRLTGHPTDAEVPLVSPHQLGGFINEEEA